MATNISTESKPKESTSAESPEPKDVNRLSCGSGANNDMEEGNAKKKEYIEKLDTESRNKEDDATVATHTKKEDQTLNNNDKTIKENQLGNDKEAKMEKQTKTDNDGDEDSGTNKCDTEIVSVCEEDVSEITSISEKDSDETTLVSETQTVSTKTIPAQTDVSATEDQPRKLRRSTRNQSFKKVCNECSTVYKDGWEKCEICSAIDESNDSNDSDADNSCKEVNDSDPEIVFINKRKSLDSKGNSKSKKQQGKPHISQDSDIELIASSSQAQQQNQLSLLVSHEKLQTVANSSKHTDKSETNDMKEDYKQITQDDKFPSVMFCDTCNTGYAHPIDFQCHYKILDCKGVSNNKTPPSEAGDREKGDGGKSKSDGEYSSSSSNVHTQLTPHYPSYSDFCRLIPYDPSCDKRQVNQVQRCFKCNMFFPSLDEFMIHLNADNDKLKKLYGTQNCLQCRWCNHRAQSLCRLQQHRFITHRMVCCTVCDKLLTSRGDLVKHMRIHSQEDVKSDKSTNDSLERNVQNRSDIDSVETVMKMHGSPVQLVDVNERLPSTETSDDQGEDGEVLPQKNDNTNKSAGIQCYVEVVKGVPGSTSTKLLKRKMKKSHMRHKFGKRGVYVCKMCDAMCQTDIALSNHKKEFHPVVYKLEQLDVQYGPAWRAKADKKKKKKRKKHDEKEIEPASEKNTQTPNKPEEPVPIGSIGNQVIKIADTLPTQGASGPKIINEHAKAAAPWVNKTPAVVPVNAQTPLINEDDKLPNIQDASIQSNNSPNKNEGNVKEDSAENKQAKYLPEYVESSEIQQETKAVNGECKSPNISVAVGSDVPGTSTGGVTESGTSRQGLTLQHISKVSSSKQYYKNPVKIPFKNQIEENSFSSSGGETDASECSWLDQSSDEDDEEDALEPGEIRLPEDDNASNSNDVDEENNAIQEANAQEAKPASEIVPSSINTTTSLPSATPVKEMPKETSSTQQNSTTNFMSELPANVLQLSNLLRTFHMVDVSELYQVAAQLIDPKDPGEGPIDEAMNFGREDKFLYKIPLGHSHPEFEDQALFPSSREVCYRTHKYKYNPQRILSVKELEKRYKRTVPKYMADIFSRCLDDAMLTHTDKLLRGISINVRRKKAEDRKDLTQRLVKYIVSRYYAKHAQEGTKVESGSAIKIHGLSASLIISPKNATPTTGKLPTHNPATTSLPSTSQIPNKVTSTMANMPQKEDTDSRISRFASMSSIRVRRFEMNHLSLSDTIGRIQHIQKFMASASLPLKVKEKIAPLCNEICDPAVPLNQKVRNVRTMEFLFTQDCGGQWNKYRTAANLPTMQKASALSSRNDIVTEQDDSCEEISAGEEGDKEKSKKKEKNETIEKITKNKEKVEEDDSHAKILKEKSSKFDKEEQIEMSQSAKGKVLSRRSSRRLNRNKSDDDVEKSDIDNDISSKTDKQNKIVNNSCEEISKKEDNKFDAKDKNELNRKAENNDKLTKSASHDETLAEDADDKMTSEDNKNRSCHNEETELEEITQDKTSIKQSYNGKELPEGENEDGPKLNENVNSTKKTNKTDIDSKFNSNPDYENHTEKATKSENENESCRNIASDNDLNTDKTCKKSAMVDMVKESNQKIDGIDFCEENLSNDEAVLEKPKNPSKKELMINVDEKIQVNNKAEDGKGYNSSPIKVCEDTATFNKEKPTGKEETASSNQEDVISTESSKILNAENLNRLNVADKGEVKSDINNEMKDDENKDSKHQLTSSESSKKVESKVQEAINSDKESEQNFLGSAKEATENVNQVKEKRSLEGTKKGDKEKEEQFDHTKKQVVGETLQQNPDAKVGTSAETIQQKPDTKIDTSGHTLQQKTDAKEVTQKDTLQDKSETNVCPSEQIQNKPEVRIPKKDVPEWTIPWNAESSSDSDSSLSSDSSLQKIVLEAINRQQLVKQAQEAQRLQREAQQAKKRELAEQKKIEELSMKKYFDSLPCPVKSTMTPGVCVSTEAPEIRLGTGNANQDTNISEKSKLEVQEGESEKKSDNDKKMEEDDKEQAKDDKEQEKDDKEQEKDDKEQEKDDKEQEKDDKEQEKDDKEQEKDDKEQEKDDKEQEEPPHCKLNAKERRRLKLKQKRKIAKKEKEEKLRRLAVMERKRELLLKQRAQVVERLKRGYRASPRLVAQNISEVRESDKDQSTDKDGSDDGDKRQKRRGESTRSGRKIPSYKEEQTNKLGSPTLGRRGKGQRSEPASEDSSDSDDEPKTSKRKRKVKASKSSNEDISESESDESEDASMKKSKPALKRTKLTTKSKAGKNTSKNESSAEDNSETDSELSTEERPPRGGKKMAQRRRKTKQTKSKKEESSNSSSDEDEQSKKVGKKTRQMRMTKQIAKRKSRKEKSSEDGSDSSSEEEDTSKKGRKKTTQTMKAKQSAIKSKTTTKNTSKKEESSEDDSNASSEAEDKYRKGEKKKAQTKKTAKTKSSNKAKKEESSEDDSDSPREKDMKSKKGAKKTLQIKQAAKTKSKREESSEDNIDSSSEDESKSKKSGKKTAQTKKRKQAAKTKSKREESSEDSYDSSSEEERKSKKRGKKTAQTKKIKQAAKNKYKREDSSEDSIDSSSEDESKSKKSGKKTAQTKKIKQATKIKSKREESSEDSFDSEEEAKSKNRGKQTKKTKQTSKPERRGRKRKDASSTTSPESDSTSSSDFFVKKTNICTKMTPAIRASINSKPDKNKQGSTSNGPVKIGQTNKRQRMDSTSDSDLERHEIASVNNRTSGSNQGKQSNQKYGKDEPSNAQNRKRPHKPAEDRSSGSDDSEVEFTTPAKKNTREKSDSSTKASGSGRTRRSNVLNQLGLTEQEIRDMVQAPRRGGNKR